MNDIFLKAYRKSTLSKAEFLQPYMIGHFNPTGNHFIAYSIKNKLVELLDPKPVPYQNPETRSINFNGYLQGGVYR